MKLLLRVIRLIKSWFNVGVSSVEAESIDALVANLENQKSSAVNKIVKRTAEIKADINDMEKLLEQHKANASRYEGAAKKALAAGNEELAKDLAQKYSDEKSQVAALETGVANSNKMYKELITRQNSIIEGYDARIAQVKVSATSVKVKEQMANISTATKFESDFSFEQDLADVEKLVSRKDSVESAKLQAASDIKVGNVDIEADKLVREQSRDEALAVFKSEMNIQ